MIRAVEGTLDPAEAEANYEDARSAGLDHQAQRAKHLADPSLTREAARAFALRGGRE